MTYIKNAQFLINNLKKLTQLIFRKKTTVTAIAEDSTEQVALDNSSMQLLVEMKNMMSQMKSNIDTGKNLILCSLKFIY